MIHDILWHFSVYADIQYNDKCLSQRRKTGQGD
uniref:Uncharacterized protein n=1 Tax=Arundo donax TaxID=35708 RepID=A0A0A9FKW0_ARUDO